jgi:site-specific DNA recombinase
MARNDGALKRCAIYTRKSSEEGLEQNFNSLHAQRQACEAFVKSQAGEGWRLVKTAYDDGGFSGATMERPALKTLLAHVKEKCIDVVVVYKVDRLTARWPISPRSWKSLMPTECRSWRSRNNSIPPPRWAD